MKCASYRIRLEAVAEEKRLAAESFDLVAKVEVKVVLCLLEEHT
jgi:hypothetical protein